MDNDYFEKYCEVAESLLQRSDRDNSAIKSIIRHVVREASNHASELPGYDNKKGAEIVSKRARAQIRQGDLNHLVGEHVVPVSIINERLLQLSKPDRHSIADTIRNLEIRAVITKAEDDMLKECGYTKAMPAGWDGNNKMHRYQATGIDWDDVSYIDALKERNFNNC